MCEKIIKQNTYRIRSKNIKLIITNEIMNKVVLPFNTTVMNDRIMCQDILDNHRIELCKLVIDLYINVRFFSRGKTNVYKI